MMWRQIVESELRLDGIFEKCSFIHTVDNRGGLVLAKRKSSSRQNTLATADTVAPHAGHQDANGSGLVYLSCRLK